MDVARPSAVDDFHSVEETLQKEVFSKGDERPPILNVLNKIDIAPDFSIREFPGVAISAREGLHLDLLREQISSIVYPGDRELVLLVPYTALRSLPLFRAKGRVEIVDYVDRWGAGSRPILERRGRRGGGGGVPHHFAFFGGASGVTSATSTSMRSRSSVRTVTVWRKMLWLMTLPRFSPTVTCEPSFGS